MTIPTVALDWNGYVVQVANMAVVNTQTVSGVVQGVDAAFNILLPQACNYAELRIQRDLGLLPAQERRTYNLTSGDSFFAIPTADFVVIRTIGVVNGTVTTPLLPVSQEWLRNVYGDSSFQAQPAYFAMIGGDLATSGVASNMISVGPYPDQAYEISVVGMVRLPSLYLYANEAQASGNYTFISEWLPDLMIQASMIYVAQFQRNFGLTVGNDPQMPGAYEAQYQTLLGGARIEEARKTFAASGWSSMAPAAVATAGR